MTSNNLYIHEISLYIHQFYEKKFLTNAEMERSNITPLEIIAPAVQENTLSNHITYVVIMIVEIYLIFYYTSTISR